MEHLFCSSKTTQYEPPRGVGGKLPTTVTDYTEKRSVLSILRLLPDATPASSRHCRPAAIHTPPTAGGRIPAATPTFPVRAAACAVPCDAAAVVRAGRPILTPPSATAPTSPSSPTLVASSRLRLLAGCQWPAVLLLVSEKVDPRRGCVTAQAAVDLGAVREHSGAATSPCPSGVRRNAYLRFSELDAPKSRPGGHHPQGAGADM